MNVRSWSVVAAVARLAIVFLALAVGRPARAQAPVPANPYDGWDNAYYQIMADELRQVSRNRTVYTSDGHAIGRIVDVRVTPDGMHEAAIVRARRVMGGGQVALPFHRLAKLNGRLVAKDDRGAVLAMDRLDARAAEAGR
ncbi:PRC-barrel domain-containing protein [Methylobacterium tarhaniae]|uniref:PRC-barrel domain-containing protein n=1 Tax=Methylobacterium tarhaniae TaxID=1187852 RepID=UPI003D05ED29